VKVLISRILSYDKVDFDIILVALTLNTLVTLLAFCLIHRFLIRRMKKKTDNEIRRTLFSDHIGNQGNFLKNNNINKENW